MLAVFKAEQWDNYGLLVVDSALIYSIVDVCWGAAGCGDHADRGAANTRRSSGP